MAGPSYCMAECSRRLAGTPEDARLARRFVTDVLTEWDMDGVIEAGQLVVSELVSNAVRYARGDLTVSLTRIDGAVRVAVADGSPLLPVRRNPRVTDRSGRGLRILEALSMRWGHEIVADGKVVWADLPVAAAIG